MATLFTPTHFHLHNLSKKSWLKKSVSTQVRNQNKDPILNLSLSDSAPKHDEKVLENPPKKLSKDELISQTRSLCSLMKGGCLSDALQMFDNMLKRDTFVWNVIIRGLVNVGWYEDAISYYHMMQLEGVKADYLTYTFVIKACSWLLLIDKGEKIQAKLVKTGLSDDLYICNALIVMYSKFGFMENSERLFEGMIIKDLVTWNSMISGYVSIDDGCHALMYFCNMQAYGMIPDRFSIISVLGACSIECFLEMGKQIHCHVIKLGLEMDVMVQTALIDMYNKCLGLVYAKRYFSGIAQKSVGVWNAMIGGYVMNDLPFQAFSCLRKMHDDDTLVDDEITMINVLPACAQARALELGKSVHGFAIRKGFISNVVVVTALIDMYGKCAKVNWAEFLFNQMTSRTVISWNVMVAAYVQNDRFEEGLNLFRDFLKANLLLDSMMIASVLPTYAELASLREGEQIHGYVVKSGLNFNTHILNAIVFMYAKCGDLIGARKLFDCILLKDVVSWNTIIMVYALHGCGSDAIDLFNGMLKEGVQPDGSTFVSLLSSCSISGMIEEGWKYFNLMKWGFGIDPEIEHYGCMVDLLGRKGNLDLALCFIEEMPLVPTSRIWGSLLAAARNSKNIEIAEHAAQHILSLDHNNHNNTGCYVLLSNLYAELGRWEDVKRINDAMKKKGLERSVQCSTLEIRGKINLFVNHDHSHKEINKIYDALAIISRKIEEDVYFQNLLRFSPMKLAQKRAKSPVFHSVRLAISFGLISNTLGSPVIVRKNNRLCEDCHTATKKISRVTQREIIVGDSKIFHRFKGGKCSCGDYW